MKIFLTGATGYIGARLLTVLGEAGHEIVALVRNASRISIPAHLQDHVQMMEGDLLHPETLRNLPKDLDGAYYLVHSMGNLSTGFSELEAQCAKHFVQAMEFTQVKHIVYLSGLSQNNQVSEHMSSRHAVEEILFHGKIPLTVLRAGIIIGSGSASFEIMRDLVEKLPIMIAPKWVYSKCQPIAIADVLFYLSNILGKEKAFGKVFEIGGPDVLTYRDMLIQFGKIRGLKRWIIPVPVLTPYLSSLWLFLITTVNFSIAQALVRSLKTDAVCRENTIQQLLPHQCLNFMTMIQRAFDKIEQNAVVSSWKDAMIQSQLNPNLSIYMKVPQHGCFKKIYKKTYPSSKKGAIDRLWCIGGKNGWYTMNWAWSTRGAIDRLVGGVGLRRGRTHPTRIQAGDALDFWRVIYAKKEEGHLLLYAEMRLPGEAWIEWKISGDDATATVEQIITFRPHGVLGRLYWYVLYPIHPLLFQRLCNYIGKGP